VSTHISMRACRQWWRTCATIRYCNKVIVQLFYESHANLQINVSIFIRLFRIFVLCIHRLRQCVDIVSIEVCVLIISYIRKCAFVIDEIRERR
jgi:hypothetical protein